jgi:hypothetical protein
MPRDGYTRSRVSGATSVATRGTASAVWAARTRWADVAVSTALRQGGGAMSRWGWETLGKSVLTE